MARDNSKINAPAEPSAYPAPRPGNGNVNHASAPNDNGLTILGHAVRDRGEMLSLTDMWKAAGGTKNQAPYEWSRREGADFIAHMEAVLNTAQGRIIDPKRGRGGQTYAHWQIALAYAKYLSPAFHAACNAVIRQHMEDRPPVAALPSELIEEIHRILGINKMLSHKVTIIEQGMAQLQGQHLAAMMAVDPRVAVLNYRLPIDILRAAKVPPKGRRGFSNTVRSKLVRYCEDRDIPTRRSPETDRQMFHVDAVDAWLKLEGNLLIAERKDKIGRQGVLKLVRR